MSKAASAKRSLLTAFFLVISAASDAWPFHEAQNFDHSPQGHSVRDRASEVVQNARFSIWDAKKKLIAQRGRPRVPRRENRRKSIGVRGHERRLRGWVASTTVISLDQGRERSSANRSTHTAKSAFTFLMEESSVTRRRLDRAMADLDASLNDWIRNMCRH